MLTGKAKAKYQRAYMAAYMRRRRAAARAGTALSAELLEALDLYCPEGWSRSDFIGDMLSREVKRRQRRYEQYLVAAIHDREAFDENKEALYTDIIKARMLTEGCCDLQWPEYFAFRNKHDCTPLTDADLKYAAAYTSCALPSRNSPVAPVRRDRRDMRDSL